MSHFDGSGVLSRRSPAGIKFCIDESDPWVVANLVICGVKEISSLNENEQATRLYCDISLSQNVQLPRDNTISNLIQSLQSQDRQSCQMMQREGLMEVVVQACNRNNLTVTNKTNRMMELYKSCPAIVRQPQQRNSAGEFIVQGHPSFGLASVNKMLCEGIKKAYQDHGDDSSNAALEGALTVIKHKYISAMSALRMVAAGCNSAEIDRDGGVTPQFPPNANGTGYMHSGYLDWMAHVTGREDVYRGCEDCIPSTRMSYHLQNIENLHNARMNYTRPTGEAQMRDAFVLNSNYADPVIASVSRSMKRNPHERWATNGLQPQDEMIFYNRIKEAEEGNLQCPPINHLTEFRD